MLQTDKQYRQPYLIEYWELQTNNGDIYGKTFLILKRKQTFHSRSE